MGRVHRPEQPECREISLRKSKKKKKYIYIYINMDVLVHPKWITQVGKKKLTFRSPIKERDKNSPIRIGYDTVEAIIDGDLEDTFD